MRHAERLALLLSVILVGSADAGPDDDARAAYAFAMALRQRQPEPDAGFRWESYQTPLGDHEDQIKLVDRDGRQVGSWIFPERQYYRLLGPGRWEQCQPPIPPPPDSMRPVPRGRPAHYSAPLPVLVPTRGAVNCGPSG